MDMLLFQESAREVLREASIPSASALLGSEISQEKAYKQRPNQRRAVLLSRTRQGSFFWHYLCPALLGANSEGDRSKQKYAEAERDSKLKDSTSRLGAFLPYEALKASEDYPIWGNVDSVGAELSYSADARKSPYETVWRQSMVEKLDDLVPNGTFTLVDELPEGGNAITGPWVFRLKVNDHNEFVRAKSRVVRGFIQELEADFRYVWSHPGCLINQTIGNLSSQEEHQAQPL